MAKRIVSKKELEELSKLWDELLKEEVEKDNTKEQHAQKSSIGTQTQSKTNLSSEQSTNLGENGQSDIGSTTGGYAPASKMASSGLTQDLHQAQARGRETEDRRGDDSESTSHEMEAESEELRSLDENEISNKLNADEQQQLRVLLEEQSSLKSLVVQVRLQATSLKKITQSLDNYQKEVLNEKTLREERKDNSLEINAKIYAQAQVLIDVELAKTLSKETLPLSSLPSLSKDQIKIIEDLKDKRPQILEKLSAIIDEKISHYKLTENPKTKEDLLKAYHLAKNLEPHFKPSSEKQQRIIDDLIQKSIKKSERKQAAKAYNNTMNNTI